MEDTPASGLSQFHQRISPICQGDTMLSFERKAVQTPQGDEWHAVNMRPACLAIESPHAGVAVKQVKAVQVVVSDNAVLIFADSLLNQRVQLVQGSGLQSNTKKMHGIGIWHSVCALFTAF